MRFWEWYAIALTVAFAVYLFVTRGPIPFTDDGHACYDARDERAAQTLLKVTTLGGMTESFTFDSGPTHQCLLSDGKTVLLWLDPEERNRSGTGNARSLVVDNPLLAAKHAASILTNAGYSANVREPPMGELGENK